jgi:segregation and condensation protein B
MESFSADRVSSEPDNTLTSDAGDASDGFVLMLAPVEAARRLGVTRSRIYALVQQGELDDVGGQTLRVTLESVERRLAANAPVGEPIKPLGAWAILALASSDAAFRVHVGARLSRWEQSRARLRVKERGLLEIAPRLRQRCVARRYIAGAEALLGVLEDARVVLAGTSALRQHGWQLPDGDWPVELYVPEAALVDVIERYSLEMAGEQTVDVVLRAVPDPWPFPAHLRVAPEIVSALDLAESHTPSLAELGLARLKELAEGIEPSWERRPPRRRPLRSVVPSSARGPRPHPRLQHSAVADAAWDDRAEQDARGLVALLFVAGGMRRTELSEALRLSAGRLDRACAFLNVSPPHGLALLESGDRIELVSAADCGPVIERFMNRPAPEPLSQAAMEVLSIVAYEQPITRAEIRHIRGTDSSGVIETLLARRLIEDDPRFGGRGRPSFLATTADFLRSLGLGSLAELPPRPVPPAIGSASASNEAQSQDSCLEAQSIRTNTNQAGTVLVQLIPVSDRSGLGQMKPCLPANNPPCSNVVGS